MNIPPGPYQLGRAGEIRPVQQCDAITHGREHQSSISALCLAYDDLLQAKVTIHDTKAKYLECEYFAGGNLIQIRLEEKLQVWYIDGNDQLAKPSVVLSSPMDFQGEIIPTRQLHSRAHGASGKKYRTGDGCGLCRYARSTKTTTRLFRHWMNATERSRPKLRFGENNGSSFGGFPVCC
ncbi:hypothetical protein ACVXG7_17165 [Enterobacter hormaechei]